MDEIKNDIKLFNMGILPDNFKFNNLPSNNLDIDQIKYNAFYKTYEYYEKKFPKGHENIPGFDKIIEKIAENSKSPLEEILERQLKIENINENEK